MPTEQISEPKATRKRILVVDDEPEIVTVLAFRLTAAGYDVLTATEGAHVAETAARDRPDLIILDIGMSPVDGHMVADQLRSRAETRNIPLIFLTARTSDADITQVLDVGAVGYVTKPYRPEGLLLLINRTLGHG